MKEKEKFIGKVVALWMANDHEMRLLEDVTYVDSNGKEWTAPEGAIVDGASIPKFLWSVIGSPFVGKYRRPSVIHDHYCVTQDRPSREVHKAFCEMMKVEGVSSFRRKLMCFAVKQFGPRW